MRVGITGATGFVGKRLLRGLAERGHEIVALVRAPASIEGVEARAFDLADHGGIAEAVAGLDAVVHAAAHLPKSYTDIAEARACLEINGLGTLAVLDACVRAAVGHVVTMSTSLYGLTAEPATESAALRPSAKASYYMVSKACGDFYAGHFAERDDIAVSTLRLGAVYGPEMTRGIAAIFASKLEAKETITLQDAGRYRSDFVYVDDIVLATDAALARSARGAYNIAFGSTRSMADAAEILRRLYDAPESAVVVQPATGDGLVGFPPLDVTRAKAELGYAPRDLETGLALYVAWRRGTAAGAAAR